MRRETVVDRYSTYTQPADAAEPAGGKPAGGQPVVADTTDAVTFVVTIVDAVVIVVVGDWLVD